MGDLQDGDEVTVYQATRGGTRYFFCDRVAGRDHWITLPDAPGEVIRHRGIELRVGNVVAGD